MAYTYLMIEKETRRKYYGVRFKPGMDGSELGLTYCSSSKVIKAIIKDKGKDAFEYHVRVRNRTKAYVLKLEERVLRHFNVSSNDDWFNLGHVTSNMVLFKNNPTDSTKRKIGAANSKPFSLYDKNGTLIQGDNLQQFARDNGYSVGNLCSVITGKRRSAHGFTSTPNTTTRYNGKATPYRFYDESGILCVIDNLKDYCKEHALSYPKLQAFIRKRIPKYRMFRTET